MNLLPIALGALLGISGIAVLVRATARPLVDTFTDPLTVRTSTSA